MGGEDEITEAYYAFSHLGCDEQMWDYEGKEADAFVVRKLLSRYEQYFQAHPLGKDRFLTLRVPNPAEEKSEAKLLLEVLESIPRSYDIVRLTCRDAVPPIFEIILPMTRMAAEISRIHQYYEAFVSGKSDFVFPDGIRLEEWMGDFGPQRVEVIPLFEDMPSLIGSANIVRQCIENDNVKYKRIFLARSDPALNYGHIAAILALKVALYRLEKLERQSGIPLFPIIGVGSCPFRGNLKPTNVQNCLRGYPSAQTFTIQSAFKYDYQADDVIEGIKKLNENQRQRAIPIENEDAVITCAEKASSAYQADLRIVAPLVAKVAPMVPRRRLRKLHIGLFGYARGAEGLSLPRAISFCAALYSVGFPPELLGISSLIDMDKRMLAEVYPDYLEDLTDALTYFNEDSLSLFPSLKTSIYEAIKKLGLSGFTSDANHRTASSAVIRNLETCEDIREPLLAAAHIRRFLG